MAFFGMDLGNLAYKKSIMNTPGSGSTKNSKFSSASTLTNTTTYSSSSQSSFFSDKSNSTKRKNLYGKKTMDEGSTSFTILDKHEFNAKMTAMYGILPVLILIKRRKSLKGCDSGNFDDFRNQELVKFMRSHVEIAFFSLSPLMSGDEYYESIKEIFKNNKVIPNSDSTRYFGVNGPFERASKDVIKATWKKHKFQQLSFFYSIFRNGGSVPFLSKTSFFLKLKLIQ